MFIVNRLLIKDNFDKKLVDISFKFQKSLAILGESGSGKSLTLKALIKMLPAELNYILSTELKFDLKRGSSVGFVPQNPFTALNPMLKIKEQFFKPDEIVKEYLKMVGLQDDIMNSYPVNLSGGQLQRVIIAIVLSSMPRVILLDEPTTALDSKNKSLIIELLQQLSQKLHFYMIFVTHDINSIKDLCEDIIVMRYGKIIEKGKTKEVLEDPIKDYTKQLIQAGKFF